MKHFHSQLIDIGSNKYIAKNGGKVYVAVAGSPKKATVRDASGAAIANPVDLNQGLIEFYVDDTVNAVDLYIQSPTGHFVVKRNVEPSGPTSFFIDLQKLETVFVIPFHFDDYTAAAETQTGFTIPGAVLPTPFVDVTWTDAGIVIDVGTLSTDSGDADGFIDGASLATAGLVKASLANGAVTLGADLKVQDSANAGDAAPEANVNKFGKQITYTVAATADTGAGYIRLPVLLTQAAI